MKILLSLVALVMISAPSHAADGNWKKAIAEQVGRLGHRNMIVIADSAYPIQAGSGVEVIVTGAGHAEVVNITAQAIAASPAVRPLIALDKEFAFVPEEHAPGASALRTRILALLEDRSAAPIREELHETLLKEVNELSGEFKVVVFKTRGVIPYSSVFFTLDCGYWSAEAEKALRAKMER